MPSLLGLIVYFQLSLIVSILSDFWLPSTPEVEDDQSCKCGLAVRNNKIVGGEETEVNEYPWQIGIVNKGSKIVWCGGSIVNSLWIVTAAHCISGQFAEGLQVLVGDHDVSVETETISQRKNISQLIIHPQYNSATNDYDFGLMKLWSPLNFTSHPNIRPICLPVSGNNDDFAGDMATVTGWGTLESGGESPVKLQEVEVGVLSNSACSGDDTFYSESQITSQMMCAGVEGGGKDSCQGDSGGPLITTKGDGVTSGQNYKLIGVVSWGIFCALPSSPGVYARISSAVYWINNYIMDEGDFCSE